ncbi:MAG: bifunctional nuclease family protein [Planctomycetaceae bacterium]|jgi:bifunctional DNase/RNase|nr:bifunctional nuclease family protein [Planctomycetaceae bacterium]
MAIPMILSRIIISEINNQQIIFLRELNGEREFYIVIGIFEAANIERSVKGIIPQRPLTHDLICKICQAAGAELLDVTITKLEEQTFYAKLQLRQGDRILEIDARPSDAIALAVTHQPPLPIYAEEEVIEKAVREKT